jgi:hypothetical protein
MGYKNKAKKINKENKKNREPIIRSATGHPFLGVRTDPEVQRHQLTQFAGGTPTMNWGYSPEEIQKYIEDKEVLNKKGKRKIKQLKN